MNIIRMIVLKVLKLREYPINKVPSFGVQLPEITPLGVKLSGSSSKSEWVCLNL
jgi:hypothetical protein